jgi:hypothetical protein
LNPNGGLVNTGPGGFNVAGPANFTVNAPTFLNNGFTVTGSTVYNGDASFTGRMALNSGFSSDILSSFRSTGQYYLLWLYNSAGTLDYSFGANGDALKRGSSSWSAFSDVRLKENVNSLTNVLDKLLQLRSVTFDYKDQSYGKGRQTGFIAQEVEKVFPDWVGKSPDGLKTLTLRGVESMTVQAIRELRAEKDAQMKKLEEENKSLRAQLDSQDKRLSKLEKLQAMLEELSKDKAAGN